MSDNFRRLRALLFVSATFAVPLSAAQAQDAALPADMAATGGGASDIVVTAQKRVQNVKDVPIAVTVIGGNRIEEEQITSFHDIERIAPSFKSLQLGDARASTMNMRGVSSVQGNPGRQSSLGVFIDGVFMARTGMASSQDFLDIERIEVLRGPQGTLFGMNTAGGLIHTLWRRERTCRDRNRRRLQCRSLCEESVRQEISALHLRPALRRRRSCRLRRRAAPDRRSSFEGLLDEGRPKGRTGRRSRPFRDLPLFELVL
jgi:outer membrane receptor for ferric coprogen and ferric-rhodotorulic acid